MKKYLIHLCLPLVLTSLVSAAEVTPDQFAGSDGLLNEKELIEFLLVNNKKSFHDVWSQKPSPKEIADEGGNIEQAKKKKLVEYDLLEIEERVNSKGPYTPLQIQSQQIVSDAKSKNYSIRGLIGEPLISGNTRYGPIQLRQKFEDWDKNINTVSGASISYTNDRIKDTGTWQTQGSLIYPIKRVSDYESLALLPSINWKHVSDIEELTFQLPLSYSVLHNTSWSSDFYFSPFYLTDFDFDGAMIGAELTYEPTIQIGRRFQTGSWHSLFGTLDEAYLFRVIPGLTYGRVLSDSSFINRQEFDDVSAITTRMELKFKPFGIETPWEIGGEYNLLYDFSGDVDGYSYYWSTNATWWFTVNVGLALKYEKGNTPLSDNEIDLTTLRLEVRL